LLLAVVEDVRDALVVDQRGVAGLGAESLEKARVAHVLVFQDLDCDRATDDGIARLPDLTHTADSNARAELVAPTESNSSCWSHWFNTASIICFPTLVGRSPE